MTDHQLAGIPIHQPLVTLARITMVLSKDELVGLLTHEVNVLRHLITKIDATSVDYRPTDSQRSSIELVRYLVMQGPAIVQAIKTGTFDGKAWGAAQAAVDAKDLAALDAELAEQSAWYADHVGAMTDEEMRGVIQLFGPPGTRGTHFVNLVLANYAAYRTQLFCYLKLCGRTELTTSNLWAGMDPKPKA
ncbi:MAG TPA: hypothetical protein DGD08_06110 [Gemmatimonas aurantiaca]|uniref:DinB family protein n=2 Tax=Gemmatimonas aurantiaca TaxID=173480 RepID=C1A6Y5_GEMAT|nr:hypothetical protein [Gemmatimonas aurantiaca]BAH37995.1 hypothetical protein GAU_0953 [Gemmatimonas aurantiaca T-27]HCT56771.1 hypothetical protein [Gemmatimonas aurantiaca]